MAIAVLTAGLACVIAAILGGGITAFGLKFPKIDSTNIRSLLALLGVVLVATSFWLDTPPVDPERITQSVTAGDVDCEVAPLLTLNEICAEGKQCDGQRDFVEVYNPNPSAVDLRCYVLGDANPYNRHALSGRLGPGDVRAWTDNDLGFGLDKDGDKVSLIQRWADGERVRDSRDVNLQRVFQQRIPDGSGDWETLDEAGFSAAGAGRSVGSRNAKNTTEKRVP